MERTQAVLLLGQSLLDYLPQARQSSSLLATEAGLTAGSDVPCTACSGKGRLHRSGAPCASCSTLVGPKAPSSNWGATHGCTPCSVCGGWGWRKRRAGEEPWDGYARVELASGDVGEGTQGDDLERRLAHTTLILDSWQKPDSIAYGWEDRKAAMWRSGDYEQLCRALARLEVKMPGRHRLWWRHVVLDYGSKRSPGIEHELVSTTVLITNLMPDRIRVPKWLLPEKQNAARKTSLWRGQTSAHASQRSQRDAQIVEQREQGWKIAKIARHHAITERRVKQIVRENTQAAVASAPA